MTQAIQERPNLIVAAEQTPVTTEDTSTPIVLAVSPTVVLKVLVAVVTCLAVAGTVADVLIFQVFGGREHKVSRLLNRIDLGFEPSVPAFYSSFALLAAAGLLGLIAIGEYRERGRHVRHWGILALLFAGMSLDEMVMLHEMFVDTLRDNFDLHGIFYFSWVIPGLITVAVVGISYLGFLFRLDSRTRWLFVTAAFLFVGGALGMEMLAGIVVEASSHGVEEAGLGDPLHIGIQTIEETGEMLGVVVFIYALLCYIEKRWSGVQLTLIPSRNIH